MKKILCFLLALSFASVAQPPAYTATVSNAPPGYYFISAYKGPTLSYPMILDETGHVVYYRRLVGTYSVDFMLQGNGQMSYYPSNLMKFIIMDSTFYPVDTISAVGYSTDTHELQILPDGHYLLLGGESSVQDLSAYNYFNHNGSPGSTNATWKTNIIQELDENKVPVFTWHHKANFPFDEVDTFFLSSPTNVDWSHSNALEVDQDSNLLMSSRHFDEITKINRSTGAIMWHFGGKYNQFTFIGDTTRFYGQHDIRRLPNGHITFYDDASRPAGQRLPSRAVEYELDEVNMTAKLVWSYVFDSLMYSPAQGSMQMLPNKNALVDFGNVNRDSVCFTVVDSLGTELYTVKFDAGYYSYRARYYSSLPWQLHRPTISCFDSLGTFYLKVDSAYGGYIWNDGSNGSTLAVTDTGTFYVFVPYGFGGYVSSYPVHITDLNSECGGTTTVGGMNRGLNYKLFPNPAQNQVTISSPEFDRNTVVTIRGVYGKRIELPVTVREGSYTFDTSGLPAGVYFIGTKYKTLKFVKSRG